MDTLVKGVEFVSYGLRSNVFGLGCPVHCSAPGFGSVLASFLLGFVVGVCLTAYLVWILCAWTFSTLPSAGSVPTPPAPPGLQVSLRNLGQYLHD